MELSKKNPFTLIVDEFQEFLQINPAVYAEIQHLWDINKGKCHLNLICIRSTAACSLKNASMNCCEAGNYNRIGSYWERGNQNEIDLVAVSDMKKTITIADIKLNKSKLSVEELKHRAQGLLASYPRYQPEWLGLSVENIADCLPREVYSRYLLPLPPTVQMHSARRLAWWVRDRFLIRLPV